MSAEIVRVNLGGIDDGQLVLANHQAGAVLDIGNGWNEIWLAARGYVEDIGSNLGKQIFNLGVMSSPSAGMANGPLTGATSHYVGYDATPFSFTYTRNAGPPVHYTSVSYSASKRVGDTTTAFGGNTAVMSGDSTVRAPFFIRIAKGSPNFSTTRIFPTNVSGLVDCSKETLKLALEQATAGAAQGVFNTNAGGSHFSSATSSGAVDEGTNGALNAICVGWGMSSAKMFWSDVYFAIKS